MIRLFVLLLTIAGAHSSQASTVKTPITDSALSAKLVANISVQGTKPGSVIAAPSLNDPNYFYHWTRDTAFVTDALAGLYDRSQGSEKARFESLIDDVISFGRQNQLLSTLSGGFENFFKGYGEPRFHVDGSPDWDDWCRPQNDGPALRALAAIHYVNILIGEGKLNKAKTIYSTDPRYSYLKSDLEFISHHWRDANCSLWEDAYGHFFFTSLVQRRALLFGADLAATLGDPLAAEFYVREARSLESEINLHWYPEGGYVVNNLNPPNGLGDNPMNLDSSVILAVNFAQGKDGYFGPDDERILATAHKLKEVFRSAYPINLIQQDGEKQSLGTAVGRYPGDKYDGHGFSGGNAWFLLVHAFAEFNYRLARTLRDNGYVVITQLNSKFFNDLPGIKSFVKPGDKIESNDPRFLNIIAGLKESGDEYLRRSLFHAGFDGSMNEQIDRVTGNMRGVPDLTWSYASLFTARWARESVRISGNHNFWRKE